MGYTHYWHRKKDFTRGEWSLICKDTRQILKYCLFAPGIPLAYEYDDTDTPPTVSTATIRFNGHGEDGHETFIMTRNVPETQPWQLARELDESFDFCKTSRKPYDLAVCLVLLSCVRHSPDSIRVTSDGDWDSEWLEARKVFNIIFGVVPECPFFREAA